MNEFDDLLDDNANWSEYADDELDFEDEFDPNRCPSCGADLVFGVCIMSDCMWTDDDDDDDDDE